MSGPTANSSKRLADAVKRAAKKAQQQSQTGAVLGTVVQGSPTLDVQTDTGQLVPQCAGPSGLLPGDRVLGHWIENGHNLAVQPMGGYQWSLAGAYFNSNEDPPLEYATGAGGVPPCTVTADGLLVAADAYYLITAITDLDNEYRISAAWSNGSHNYNARGSSAHHLVLPAGSVVFAHEIVPSAEFAAVLVTVDWRAPHPPLEGNN